MKILTLLILQTFLTLIAWGDSGSKLREICEDETQRKYSAIVKKNKESYRFIYIVVNDEKNRKHFFDCSAFSIGPISESTFKEKYSANCAVTEHGATPVSSSFVEQISDVVSQVSCEDKKDKELTSPSCMKDLHCNLERAVATTLS